MFNKIFKLAVIAFAIAACNQSHKSEIHDTHDKVKFQYTTYTNDFELFAEADAFVVGESANVLAHFSNLPDFTALEDGSISIHLIVNGNEIHQTLEKPTRLGIYSFDLKTETAGKGVLRFEISRSNQTFEVVVPEIIVFASHKEASEAAKKNQISETNTTVFTKEQSWKVEFSTDFPHQEPFGQIIKTTAQVHSSQGDEIIVTAKTNGIVKLTGNNILAGKDVSAGQHLFTVSGGEFADNNISIRYAEAKNNLEKASSEYERSEELAKNKIVSDKDLLTAKNQFENAKAIFENLNRNFSSTGQNISSPMHGFIKQVFVKNGSYVEAGQPIVTIAQNKTLMLLAEVQQKYASILHSIHTATIRTLHDNQTYSLEQLNGKIVSYGKSANDDNYLIPVNLQIDNNGNFLTGGFVEIFLKTRTNSEALTVPVTSILEEHGSFFVYVQITPELFEKREVKPGASDGLKIEILKGISIHERIVTKGGILIKLAQATGTLDAHSGHVH
ncbi:MAG: efflux RND transporter periplasmic adaptor subunit [Bacteroidales bacterium]|nr:efflux RND transporter periplasmic adaptor subunit [Bacteroidales bacterium]